MGYPTNVIVLFKKSLGTVFENLKKAEEKLEEMEENLQELNRENTEKMDQVTDLMGQIDVLSDVNLYIINFLFFFLFHSRVGAIFSIFTTKM